MLVSLELCLEVSHGQSLLLVQLGPAPAAQVIELQVRIM